MPRKKKTKEKFDPTEIIIDESKEGEAEEKRKHRIKQQFLVRLGVQAHMFYLMERFSKEEAVEMMKDNLNDYFTYIWDSVNDNIQRYNNAKSDGLKGKFAFLFDGCKDTEDLQAAAAQTMKAARRELEEILQVENFYGNDGGKGSAV